jgi:hypothetical protein
MSTPRRRLFQRTNSATARNARRIWKQTSSSQAIEQMVAALGGRVGAASTVFQQALKEWQQHSRWTDSTIARLAGADFGSVIREVQRTLRQGGIAGQLVSEVLGALGPVGNLIDTLVTSQRSQANSLNADVESAMQFLDAMAPDTLSGPGRRAAKSGRHTRTVAQQIESAVEFLQSQGYEVTAPAELAAEAEKPVYPAGSPITKSAGRSSDVEVDIDGTKKTFPADHPIVTGNYVQCGSSNVHSFAYQLQGSRLLVRYLPSAAEGRGKGTLYAYENVPPRKFLALLNAGSKGGWIWDNLRIRGTVSGHQHDYRLVAVTGGYVPRKATYGPRGEMYVTREMQFRNLATKQFRVLKSALPPGPVGPPGQGRR